MTQPQLAIKPKSFLSICRRMDPSECGFWNDPMNYFNTRAGAVAHPVDWGRTASIVITFKSSVDKTMFMLYYGDLIEICQHVNVTI